MLSQRSLDLLFNDLALASGARGHVKVGLVSLLDTHVDRLFLERGSGVVVAERANELLVDAEEGHDQGRVEESSDRHAPSHFVMMLAIVMSLAAVVTLSMAALLSLYAVLAVLALLAVFLVKMTAAVALVN